MRLLAIALVAALLGSGCDRPPAADGPVQVAERAVERFREMFNDDVGSLVADLMELDDAATVEWGTWLKAARSRLGPARTAEPLGREVVSVGEVTSVELRFATRYAWAGRVRELFVVRLVGTEPKIAFWTWWWP